jgi:hypothetical protein
MSDFEAHPIGTATRIEELERDLDNERARGIHTCHSKCQRPLCVAHRRIAELEAQCRFHIAEAKNADELVLKENRKLLTRIAEIETARLWCDGKATELEAENEGLVKAWNRQVNEMLDEKAKLNIKIEQLRAVYEAGQLLVKKYTEKPFTGAASPLEIEDVLRLSEALAAVEETDDG